MPVVSAELQILLAGGALCGIGVAASLLVRNYRRRWALVSIKGDLTSEHHLPDTIPVPRQHVARVREGDFGFDEAVAWMSRFVQERRWHRRRDDYRRVLRKYELYRQLAEKMGRGLWREVYALGQRLAELDPLDPERFGSARPGHARNGQLPRRDPLLPAALELAPFHSAAFPEMAAACRQIGQPGRFRAALDKARQELGDTHPLTIEGRIQLGELVRVYADPTDPATIAHIPREQYLQNLWSRIEETPLDPATALNIGRSVLVDDLPELAEAIVDRSERDYGESAESLLLQGMVAHYRLNLPLRRAVRAAITRA